MKMRTVLAVALVLVFVALPAAAAPQPPPELTSAGEGDEGTTPPMSPEAVLLDQPSNGSGGVASQYLPDYGMGFYSADDFQNTEVWALDHIFIDGSWNGGGSLPDAITLNWYIYADAGGVPAGHPEDGGGTEVWSYSCAPNAPEVTLSGAYNDDATLDIVLGQGTQFLLAPGHWWLVFFPSLNYTLHNQWWWDRAGTMSLVDAQLIDPNNLFGSGWTSWTSWYNIIDPGLTYDLAFRLEGGGPTAVTVRDFSARTFGVPVAAVGFLVGAVAVGGVFLLRRRRP